MKTLPVSENTLPVSAAMVEGVGEESLFDLVEQVTDQLQRGEPVDLDRYAADYPEYAEQLQKLLPALAAVEEMSQQDGGLAEQELVRQALGDFRIVREIGRGGMGVVYEAEELSLGRRIALKVLPFAAMLDKRALARFQNEARAAATLKHENIVSVHSVGAQRGVHYYAMELVEGTSLANVIDQLRTKKTPEHEPPSAADTAAAEKDTCAFAALSTVRRDNGRARYRRVAELGVELAEALDHAHQHGIVHRDIKPGNILLDSEGKPWITDFGLARLETDASMTRSGDLLGTLRYMSPEQAAGNRPVLDHRTDVYSLGVTLYELLTLKPAFSGDNRQELLRRIASEDPPPLRRHSAHIPAELETIVQKATAKAPAERYPTSQDLAEDLRRFLNDEPIKAKPPSMLQRSTKWANRHHTLLGAAGVFLILATIGVAITAALVTREQARTLTAYRQEAAQMQRAQTNLRLALRALDQIYLRVAEENLPKSHTLAEQDRALLTDALSFYQQFAAQNQDDPAVRVETAKAFQRVGRIEARLGRYDAAQQAYERAIALFTRRIATSPSDEARSELARTHYRLGAILVNAGRNEPAEQHLREAIRIDEQLTAVQPHELDRRAAQARHCNRLAALLQRTRRLDEADRLYREALLIMDKVLDVSPHAAEYLEIAANLHHSRGLMWVEHGRTEDAERAYARSLELFHECRGEGLQPLRQLKLAALHNSRGALYWTTERPEQATAAFQDALAIQEELARTYPQVPSYQSKLGADMSNLAVVMRRQGDLQEEQRLLEKAIKYQQRAVKANPKHTQYREFLHNHYWNLSTVLEELGADEEAIDVQRSAVAVMCGLAEQHPAREEFRRRLAEALSRLAMLLRQNEQLHDAIPPCLEAITIYQSLADEDTTEAGYWEQLATHQYNLANLYNDTDDLARAEAAYRAALRIDSGLPVVESQRLDRQVRIAKSNRRLAGLLRRSNRWAEAAEITETTLAQWHVLCGASPSNAEYLSELARTEHEMGHIHEHGGRYEQAVAAYEAAIEHAPDLGVQGCLAWLWVTCHDSRFRDADAALATAKRSLQEERENSDWYTILGMAHYFRGDYRAAIDVLKKSLELDAQRHTARGMSAFYLSLAWHRVGDTDAAEEWYHWAVDWMEEHAPEDALLRDLCGEASTLLDHTTHETAS